MAEQTVDVGRGITLCYERLGTSGDPPLLLVMGLGQQLLAWPDEFCHALVERGFEVIRFDNRDIGRSTHLRIRPPRISQLISTRLDAEQYDVSDMAADTAGLIDAIGIKPAHVVGVSLGGMIAQTVAALHPESIRSLVSIMSTTGSRRVGWVSPSVLPLLLSKPARERDAAIERSLAIWRRIGSRGFPLDEAATRERAQRAFDRDPKAAAGSSRQMAAVLKSGDRTPLLRRITAPTLVIHGDHDRMVHPSGGRATAAAIPGARSETIAGLGHDIPPGAYARMIELIADHLHAADARTAAAGAAGGDAAAA